MMSRSLSWMFIAIWAAAASAQSIPFPGPGMPAAAAPSGPLLDSLAATARVAYSTKKLRAAYAGSAVQVTRTSDTTTQDIGFDGSGNLDTSALTTFCTGSTCGVSIWYDQMGLANCVQSTASAQARLYGSGAIDTFNSHAAPRFGVISAATYCLVTLTNIAQPNTIALASKHNTQVVNGHYTDGNTNSPRSIIGVSGGPPPTTYQIYAGSALAGGTLDTNGHALIGIFNGASSSLIVDGSSTISGNISTQGITAFVIGAAKGSGAAVAMDGYMGEFIVFNSSISGGDQALIRSNWQSYWGTP